MENNKCNVFISYTRADYVDAARNVIPGNAISLIKDAFDAAGITYWFDEKGVFAGDPFVPAIADAIENCDVVLYVSSERANASPWTCKEIATAFAYNKKIIPFRLDQSRYNKSVILYIQNLDYIDYQSNPSKAVSRLVSSVNEYLTQQRKLRAEQELKEKQEQAALAAELELSVRELNTDEGLAQNKRRRITLDVQKIEDEDVRNRLADLIDQSGPIHLAHKQERARLTSEIDTLNGEINELNYRLAEQVKRKSGRVGMLWVYISVALALLACGLSVGVVTMSQALRQTEETYNACIIKNAISITNADIRYTAYNEIPDKIALEYKLIENSPIPIESVKIDVLARCSLCPETIEESYWNFYPNEDRGLQHVTIFKMLVRLVEQCDPLEQCNLPSTRDCEIPFEIVFSYKETEQYVVKFSLNRKQVSILMKSSGYENW